MGELVAQEFLVMGVEIDHREPPARGQRPRRFAKRPRRIVEEVQHLVDDDQIIGVALDRRGVDVALAERDVAQAGLIDAGSRERQHRRALIDADRARRRGLRSSSMRPVPVPRSSRLRYGFRADHGEQRRLDALLRRVQSADLIPIDGALGEIGRGLPAPGLAHDLEPGAVGADHRIGRIETAQPVARQRAAAIRQGGRTPTRPRAAASRDPPRPKA